MSDTIKVRKYIENKFHLPYRWNLLLIKCFITILSLASFVACVDDDFSLGNEYLKGNMRIVYVDTCTAVIKTVWEDSIVTSGLGFAIAGQVKDSIFGKTTAISYLPFRLPEIVRHEFFVFDSISFNIRYASEYYGDTSLSQVYTLYRLTNEFSETAENFHYYSTESVTMDTLNPILSDFHIKPSHATKKAFRFRLPESFGVELLNKFMSENDQDLADNKNFATYFSGFALVPTDNKNNLISGFSAKSDSSISINLYYHYYNREKDMYNNVDKQNASITVVLNKDRVFNQIKTDRTGTPLASLGYKKHELLSTTTNNQVFIQALTGLSMEMEFPYLKDLNLLGQNVGILGVNLVLRPIRGTYNSMYPLPDSLSLMVLDQADSRWGAGAMRINKDDINYGMNIDYEVDITEFFKDQIKAFGIDRKRVKLGNKVLTSDGFLRRAVLANDQKNFNDRLKIELKLIIYAD